MAGPVPQSQIGRETMRALEKCIYAEMEIAHRITLAWPDQFEN